MGSVLRNVLTLHDPQVGLIVVGLAVAALGLTSEDGERREALEVGDMAGLDIQPLARGLEKGVWASFGPGRKWWTKPSGGPASIPPGMGDGAGLARRSSVADAGRARPTVPTAPTTAAMVPVPTSSRRRPIRRGALYWRPSISFSLLFILRLLCPYGFRFQQEWPSSVRRTSPMESVGMIGACRSKSLTQS